MTSMRMRFMLLLTVGLLVVQPSARAGIVPSFSDVFEPRRNAMETPSVETPYQKVLREAGEQLQRGDLSGAEKTLQSAIKLDPKDFRARLALTQIAENTKRPKDADRWLNEAQTASPQSIDVAIAASRLALSRGNTVTAERTLRETAKQHPKSPLPHNELGDLYFGTARPKEAQQAYQSAIAVAPDNGGAYFGVARAQLAQGDRAAAAQSFERSGQLTPNSPLPWLALAELHVATRAFEQALAAVDRAQAAAPNFMPARLARGDILAQSGKAKQSIEVFTEALKSAQGPLAAQIHSKIGMVHQQEKRLDDADRAYAAAIEVDPKFVVAYNNRAWLAADRKRDLDNALGWAKKAVELSPKTPTLHDTLSFVHLSRNEAGAAVASARAAVQLDPKSPSYLYTLGSALEQQKIPTEALEAYRKALDLKTDFINSAAAKKRVEALSRR